MKEITVEVNQRSYALTTDPEAEWMVHQAVEGIDRHARELVGDLGFMPETTLLLLAGIRALSEAHEERESDQEAQREAAWAIRDVASRMRSLAARLGS